MKTYVIMISRTFPATHPRKGEETEFLEKILQSDTGRTPDRIGNTSWFLNFMRHEYTPKLHTCRANYELWSKRVAEVQAGRAELSLRYWEGKPYRSRQYEFLRLGWVDGIGIQELSSISGFNKIAKWQDVIIYKDDNSLSEIPISTLAQNDGLSIQDFKDWFEKYDLSKSMAIIHFTKFRY